MRGIIMVTDRDWFDFLSRKTELDEVNFWRPSDTERPGFAPGTPILFKLKKHFGGSIVGFGVFHSHVVLPAWEAWRLFGEGNGAVDFEQMRDRIARLRRGGALGRGEAGAFQIGCLLLSRPVFLQREDWIAPPADWHDNIVQGKGYDLSSGEGARVWNEMQLRRSGYPTLRQLLQQHRDERPRYGEAILVQPRLGQGTFRLAVTDAYERACVVTGEHSLPALEAAHIKPYSAGGPHEISNGLLLRSDIHRLYDLGYVGITPGLRFAVSCKLRDDFSNGRSYYPLEGQEVRQPKLVRDRPGEEWLEWHMDAVFRR
jgi:putative restriction endonuclease